MQLYVGSDNLLWLLGLVDDFGGDSPTNYVTDATVTATILSADATTTIATVTLSYVAGSITVNGNTYAGGNYRGQMPYSTALADATQYLADVLAVSGSNRIEMRVQVAAAYAA